MFVEVKTWVFAFEFTSLMGMLLYWLPLAICAIAYFIRTSLNYRKDIVARDEVDAHNVTVRAASEKVPSGDSERYYLHHSKTYNPTDTLGDVVGRIVVCFVPVVNIWAAVFDCLPDMLGDILKHFGRMFTQPLVPQRKARVQ